MPKPLLATVLAKALLAGDQEMGSIVARVRAAVGRRGLPAISRRYLAAFASKPFPRQREVVDFLLQDEGFRRLHAGWRNKVEFRQLLTAPQTMRPATAAADWHIPSILSIAELAAWLRLTPEELEWFADPKGFTRRAPARALHHYYYTTVTKRNGSLRLIEAPKQHLKLLQRQVLHELLDPIPVHAAAHGFAHGRSIRSFAAPHTGKSLVLRMDIEDFFPSISAFRVAAFFRTAGYPEAVADRLSGLCCNAVPRHVWESTALCTTESVLRPEVRSMYARPHLPQGAPTSPALANFCAYRLDCRLRGLADSAGAAYTRYADDLAFSGGDTFARSAERFADRVGAILLEEGFRAHYRKTRIQRHAVRQQLAGLVVNQHLNIARENYDRLKAILTNCVRYGPAGQNRDSVPDFQAHLNGRIGFVESIHPGKGAKLRQLFERISW